MKRCPTIPVAPRTPTLSLFAIAGICNLTQIPISVTADSASLSMVSMSFTSKIHGYGVVTTRPFTEGRDGLLRRWRAVSDADAEFDDTYALILPG